MKSLIVDDDFFNRRILQSILVNYGESHVAVNGQEALFAFEQALEEKAPYEAICLDIMMPGMDGQEVLKKIRQIETDKGLAPNNCVKVIMTTALDDSENIKEAFKGQCEAYLIKPINKTKLIKVLTDFGLIS